MLELICLTAPTFDIFRKGVVTQLETAGVPENVTSRLFGHEFHTMSYGVYSGGVSFEVQYRALGNLDWHFMLIQ